MFDPNDKLKPSDQENKIVIYPYKKFPLFYT